ncbi:CaiB/BaiF CoA transferase family protein [Rhodococcus artemisiae]|uniref:CoA transferase n=1 Tax=Rhodococcus artemisiae TaxID=714159 RepID=A0ABU7L763_9NOCA|nr:CoA transferase [Rhodococcus artemisiae]MEE2057377.1 CoA transferase [Rhodococcus artemisiae]
MTRVMQGVRILEVAEHTFVPAASALLADWGADVIKVEHVARGDAMRGLASSGIAVVPDDVHVLFEHSNRGKRSIGLDLTSEIGHEILCRLAATADVFLTNKLPSVRAKLKIDVADIRKHNPQIIYVRGTGQGERGPDADRGAYDSLAFWARAGVAAGVMRPEYGEVPVPPAPGFGDSIGGMTIAGGISSALFHRERTGEATTVDVSLMGTAMWSMGQALALSLQLNTPWTPPPAGTRSNPLTGQYATRDGRWLSFTCLQAGRYWSSMCKVIGRPEMADDPRFIDHGALMAHCGEAIAILRDAFAERSLAEWRERLADFTGQWCVVQDTLEAVADPQTDANGYIQQCATSEGVPFRLAAAPVQFDECASAPRRAPEFNEHCEDVLGELGFSVDDMLDLKIRGVVT